MHIEGIPSPFFIMLNLTVLFMGSNGLFPNAAVRFPILGRYYRCFSFSQSKLHYQVSTYQNSDMNDEKHKVQYKLQN